VSDCGVADVRAAAALKVVVSPMISERSNEPPGSAHDGPSHLLAIAVPFVRSSAALARAHGPSSATLQHSCTTLALPASRADGGHKALCPPSETI
jgi:hypothetical protein